MDQNLKLKRENNNDSGYLHEKHGTLSLPQDPAPSSLLLQGERGSSGSSSELSSSEGVWLERKLGKMRENEKEWELLKGSHPEILLMSKKGLSTVSSLGAFIANP